MTEIDRHVGSKIRFFRLQTGLSQEALAKRIGISYQQLYKYENGSNSIAASRLADLSSALEVPVHHFFEGFDSDEHKYTHHTANHRQHIQFIKYYNRIRSARYRNVIQLMIRTFSSEPLGGK